jgi:competence protein ComEA
MVKMFVAILALLCATAAFAAVDVNKATVAELDGIRGIGPGTSGRILDERGKRLFKDWNDLIQRVKGVGPSNAARLSAAGMTVDGAPYERAAIKPGRGAQASEIRSVIPTSTPDCMSSVVTCPR